MTTASLVRCVVLIVSVVATGCSSVAGAERVKYYADDTFSVCHPSAWTTDRKDDPGHGMRSLTVRFGPKVVVTFMEFPARPKDRLAEFQLAATIAKDLGISGTLRERPTIAVFGGAEGTKAHFTNATTPEGPADVVDVYARYQYAGLQRGIVFVGIGVVGDTDSTSKNVLEQARGLLDSTRFVDVPQLASYSLGEADCSNEIDSRLEGEWVSSRDGRNWARHKFDDGKYTEWILASTFRGTYHAAAGRLQIEYASGKSVSCRYTVRPQQITLRNCNLDFPTVLSRP
jgi:hypothetical protein